MALLKIASGLLLMPINKLRRAGHGPNEVSHYPGTEVPWIATAANPDRNWSTGKAIGEVYGGQHPAHIIVTNDESFRNRLSHPMLHVPTPPSTTS